MLKEKQGVVSIWVGTIVKKAELTAYCRESFSRRDDDEPISRFAADCGVTFYDHDTMEARYVGRKSLSISQLVEGHSYGRSFASAAAKLAEKADIKSANAVILFYDQVLSPARWPKDSLLRHLGFVPYSFNTPMKEQALDQYRGHEERVLQICFAPNSSLVVTGDDNGSILVWDSATGTAVTRPQQAFKGVSAGLSGFQFNADGSQCLMRTWYQSRLWVDFPLAGGLRGVCDAACTATSQDGNIGFAPCFQNIKVFDVLVARPKRTLPIRAVHLAVSANQLIAIDDHGVLTVRNLLQNKQLVPDQTVLENCDGLALTSAGLVLAWDSDRLAGFDLARQNWRWTVHDCGVRVMAVGLLEKLLVAPYKEPAAVYEWHTGRKLKSLNSGTIRYSDVAISRNEVLGLGVANDGRCLDLWQIGNARLLARYESKLLANGKSGDGFSTAALSDDGKTIVAGTFRGRILFLRWDGKVLTCLT